MHALPSSLAALLASSPVVGFSGSRAPRLASRAALALCLRASRVTCPSSSAARVASTRSCARPAPRRSSCRLRAMRRLCSRRALPASCATSPRSRVFWWPFPLRPAHPASRPRAARPLCFSGHGSGTWASVALAAGLGCAALVYLPPGIPPPAWLGTSLALPSGWHLHRSTAAQTVLL